VEIEFTLNFTKSGHFRINLLQCRPLQRYCAAERVDMPEKINKIDILFSSKGYFLGGNILQKIDKVIYVDPKSYIGLSQSEKYDIARNIGKINNSIKDNKQESMLLIGPGRWGTSTPSLGVPVSFYEISNVRIMAEVAFPEGYLMPELSFGTHFFQDLVETGIFYIALFTDKEGVLFNDKWFSGLKNLLADMIPQADKYKDCISAYDLKSMDVKLISDIVSQRVICFRER
jgi:hypothetical protein